MALGPRISKFGGTAGNIRGLSPGPPSLGVPQGIDEACPWVLLVQGHSHEEKEPALEAPTLWFGGRHRSALDTSSFGEQQKEDDSCPQVLPMWGTGGGEGASLWDLLA